MRARFSRFYASASNNLKVVVTGVAIGASPLIYMACKWYFVDEPSGRQLYTFCDPTSSIVQYQTLDEFNRAALLKFGQHADKAAHFASRRIPEELLDGQFNMFPFQLRALAEADQVEMWKEWKLCRVHHKCPWDTAIERSIERERLRSEREQKKN